MKKIRYSFCRIIGKDGVFCMSISISDELQLFAQEIQSFLSPNILRDLARDVGFVQRTSKYQAKDLVALCVWMSQNIATTSLTQLSSCLEASTEVLISPEGLNQRFNQAAVQFLQHLLAELLNQKLTSSMPISSPYTSIFKRIRILDSTAFQLPDPFSFVYPGAGGCSHTAGVKIQLEYDLLSGQFLHIHTGPGKQHDRTYGSLCVPTVTANDLCIRDLGYFHLKDLQHIQEKKAYYISRIKSNTRIYQKNPNPDYFQDGRIKKGTEYIQIDMEVLMNSLQPGQTCEISNAYVGMTDKVPTRVIVHRLTKEQQQKRLQDQTVREKKKGMKYSARSKRLSGINVYMTNTPTDIVQWDKYMIGILYVGKSRFYLKRGNHSFIFIIVKDKTRTIGMPSVWAIDCHSTLFFYHVSNAAITSYEKETRTE